MNIRRIIAALGLAALTSMAAGADVRGWESAERFPVQIPSAPADEPAVAVADGYVYVALRQRTSIGLFTILGQPVARAVLPAGNYRFRLTQRGIYLLKLGEVTRRITM